MARIPYEIFTRPLCQPLRATITLGLLATPAISAQGQTVAEMLPHCEALLQPERAVDDLEAIFCLGFVAGVGSEILETCDPATPEIGLTNEAGVEAFLIWARENPELWSLSFSQGVSTAIGEATNC